jgi:hypothetical protein
VKAILGLFPNYLICLRAIALHRQMRLTIAEIENAQNRVFALTIKTGFSCIKWAL